MPEPKTKILIVDDDPDVQLVLSDFCFDHGYEVVVAGSGDEALEKVRDEKPDLVMLDLMMPEMDGIDTLKGIHQIVRGLPVVMITGFADEALAREAMSLGAVDYVLKPVDYSQLELILVTSLVLRQDAA